MEYIIVALLSVLAYHSYLVALARSRQRKREQTMKQLDDIARSMLRKVTIDIVDGQMLAYDAKTNAFLTKFENLSDLAKRLETIDTGAIWMFTEEAYNRYMQEKVNANAVNYGQKTNTV